MKKHSFIKSLNYLPTQITLLCIQFYKVAVSPLLLPSCRHMPSCSEYALLAYKKWGFWKGSFLTCKRLMRCNPFVAPSVDEVP